MSLYVYMCIYICICIYIYVYVYIYIQMYICRNIYVEIYMYICICILGLRRTLSDKVCRNLGHHFPSKEASKLQILANCLQGSGLLSLFRSDSEIGMKLCTRVILLILMILRPGRVNTSFSMVSILEALVRTRHSAVVWRSRLG